jgi:signal transduction histidine kinase
MGKDTFYVSDTGTGVKKEMEYILFEPLQSGKGPSGRGMGLYIVKCLLESFGGKIELLNDRNREGNRYIFAITVPEGCF